MRKTLLSVMLALPILANAQNAKVIVLPKDIADEAKAAYAQKAEAEKRIAAVEEKAYALVSKNDSYTYWAAGVEFSDDFKAIVPKPFPAYNYWSTTGCSYFTLPSYGTVYASPVVGVTPVAVWAESITK
jgi:hypothetical protein